MGMLWVSPVISADLNAGIRAFVNGDYKTALKELRPLAENGNADAQGFLGQMYFGGKGVPRDDRQAFNWTMRAAEQGDPSAHFTLGLWYAVGAGVSEDVVQSYMWIKLSAQNGFSEAELILKGLEQERMSPDQILAADSMAERCVSQQYKNCGY